MRILLAAVNAQKGDLDGNLARHLAVLDQARAQGCDLAVFPRVLADRLGRPRRHPERTLALDDLQLGPWIGRRCRTFWLGRWMTQRERWLLCRAEPFDVVATPRDLPDLLDRIARGDLPDADDDLGI